MDTLTAARAQMEMSLAFHMIFAAFGIGMPLMLVIAEGLYLRTGQPHWREIARRQARATAVLFAIGAVSGTALSFELGLLWPRFMQMAGPVLGPTFALEGYAFFLEAIFIGLYLYGWQRLTPKQHWLVGIPVAVSGALSGALVVAANAWMQTPPSDSGRLVDGMFRSVDPLAPFRSPAWANMAVHALLACYVSVGFALAGVSAWALLRGRDVRYHRSALDVSMVMAAIGALLQLVSGDFIARMVARTQPIKLAAMEAHFHTTRGAAIVVGGVVDQATGTVRGAIHIPKALSFLVDHRSDSVVRGLRDFPSDLHPNVMVVHTAFDVMVGCGMALVVVGGLYAWVRWHRARDEHLPRWLLWALVSVSPLGFLALEAGWVVTEMGRQPWLVQGLMRTREGVTTASSVGATLALFTALYLTLAAVVLVMLRSMTRASMSVEAKA
jgi:cytochrome d ubiquinol oxidase subunit I